MMKQTSGLIITPWWSCRGGEALCARTLSSDTSYQDRIHPPPPVVIRVTAAKKGSLAPKTFS